MKRWLAFWFLSVLAAGAPITLVVAIHHEGGGSWVGAVALLMSILLCAVVVVGLACAAVYAYIYIEDNGWPWEDR